MDAATTPRLDGPRWKPPGGRNADRPLLKGATPATRRPIFIMGLHRSGTTFLYQALSELLPVASVRVHHIACYSNLLASQRAGTLERDRQAVDAFFEAWGLSTRKIDGLPLSHRAVEEYGWALAKRAGAFELTSRTRATFDELRLKLERLEPEAQALLFKNPWDAGRAAQIAAFYPDARFVFLHRSPMAVLSSQYRATLDSIRERNPFLEMLLQGVPWSRPYFAVRRWSFRLWGEERYGKRLARAMARDLCRQVSAYRRALAALPPSKVLELSYEDLMREPHERLRHLAHFLELAPIRPLDSVRVQPRESPIAPEVERWREEVERRLKA